MMCVCVCVCVCMEWNKFLKALKIKSQMCLETPTIPLSMLGVSVIINYGEDP